MAARSAAARRSHYLKVRDRESYEFAASSAAVGLELEADGRTVRDVRVALGGVATKPWRCRNVEDALRGRTFDEAAVREQAGIIKSKGIKNVVVVGIGCATDEKYHQEDTVHDWLGCIVALSFEGYRTFQRGCRILCIPGS